MPVKLTLNRILIIVAVALVFCIPAYVFRVSIINAGSLLWAAVSNREHVESFIQSFGMGAPFVFMFLQILQVIFAPVPGEATGFIGGYLFGTFNGFFYSSTALAIGSWLNFIIGRFLGKRYVRKLIPGEQLKKFDRVVRRQGLIIIFTLFVLPGFPKDYLCLFLGVSAMPVKAFVLMAAIGRMPGTFMLSLQGNSVFDQDYLVFVIVMVVTMVVAMLGYLFREDLYQWIDQMNGKDK